jgi:hypothetical protein
MFEPHLGVAQGQGDQEYRALLDRSAEGDATNAAAFATSWRWRDAKLPPALELRG